MNPPGWLAAIVRFLVPPVAREHVLGDLHERLEIERPRHRALAYFQDALQTVPLVIWSQMRRSTDPLFLRVQTLVLYGAFVSGAFWPHGGGGLAFLNVQHGLWLLVPPTVISLAVLTIADAYTVHRKAAAPIQSVLVLIALGIAWLANGVVNSLAPSWAVPTAVLMWGLMVGFGCTAPLRYLWATRRPLNQSAAIGPRASTDIHSRARCLAQGVHRRTRAGYVVTLAMAATFGWLGLMATNPLQRIGAIATAAASLYMASQLRRARPAPLPNAPDESAWFHTYRAELTRQRDFHGGPSFWWRLTAMLPGYLLFLGGMAVAHPQTLYRVGMIGAVFLLFWGLAIPMNLRIARQYQQQLDALREDPI